MLCLNISHIAIITVENVKYFYIIHDICKSKAAGQLNLKKMIQNCSICKKNTHLLFFVCKMQNILKNIKNMKLLMEKNRV